MHPSIPLCFVDSWMFCQTQIYVFGLTIVACFFLFLWMLKKLSLRFNYEYHFFTDSVLWYFLSVFFFSRLFYVIAMWRDMKHIDGFFTFFITSDYNFSLYWALFGFFVPFLFKARFLKKPVSKYIDGVVIAFLFVTIPWYIGAFFGWQVYGKITSYGIEIPYTSNTVFVPLTGDLFPLPLVYAFVCFLLFSFLYIVSLYVKTRGIIGYGWLGIFSAIVLGLDFFSWKIDIFTSNYSVNISQVCAAFTIIICFYWIAGIIKSKPWDNTLLSNNSI